MYMYVEKAKLQTESRSVFACGWGWESQFTTNWHEGTFRGDEKCSKIGLWCLVYITLNILRLIELYT